MGDNVLIGLDDILTHPFVIEDHLKHVETVFHLCAKHRLKLHTQKCELFTKKVRWLSRIISENNVKFDPSRLNELLSMQEPTHGGHLQQFICALQWVRSAVPKFNTLVELLHKFLERVYQKAGRRTKRFVSQIRLSALGSSSSEKRSFENCKKALPNQVTLTHRDESKRLRIYTYSSDHVWSGILTQIPTSDIGKEHIAQNHEPLAFLSGRFNNTQLRWYILEKESFATLASLQKIHWMCATSQGFDLFTDHNNLIFLFNQLSVAPDLSLSSLKKGSSLGSTNVHVQLCMCTYPWQRYCVG